ncbi:integrin-linked kinase-associated serine/threonine phosphatase 2C [Elysia marginata]|uniref:Integrin-linked kinase-associated serine/threonine phosphatase 2C n=1 Tax=Elysia marginata TaxID=1093978 RepID=A0AAV4HXW5_9GAST|nr:integrin-linked kinase-associated serine/threonine phosphatase 2C [Elysia marginata]
MDLFGDLPEPDNTKLSNSTPQSADPPANPTSAENSNSIHKIEKRKSQDEPQTTEPAKVAKQEPASELIGSAADSPQLKHNYVLKGYVADRQGEREDMQDAHVIMNDFLKLVPEAHKSITRLSLYAVFDGHGGVRASRFASQHLHNNLRDRFPKGELKQVEKEIKKIFLETFKKTDEDFLKEAARNKPSWKDGTTAVVVLAINDTLYIANLGDSKAVLCRYKECEAKHMGVSLTVDHSPSVYEERIRIQKAGGVVREGRVLGVLEVSRSIGDGPYKRHGVTCVPDVKRCQLTDNDRYLMIACDGLWKSYSVDESIQFANKILEDPNVTATGRKTPEDLKFDSACSKLANSAVLRLSGDNVTVVMVSISKRL